MSISKKSKSNEPIKFITRYGEHLQVLAPNYGPSRTKQDGAEEADINNIMAKFQKTGELPSTNSHTPIFGDFSTLPDFQEAQNIIAQATEQFAAMPAKLRDRFGNSPSNFLEWAENPANQDEMVKLGLATRRESEASSQELEASSEKKVSKKKTSSETPVSED